MLPINFKRSFHFGCVLLGLSICIFTAGCSKGGAGTDTWPTDDLGGNGMPDGGGRPDLLSSIDMALPPAEGKPVWGHSYADTNLEVVGVASGPDGSVYLAGAFTTMDFGDGPVSSNGGFDTFLLKFDKMGKRLWVRTFGSTATDVPHRLAVDRAGNAAVTGYLIRSATEINQDVFVAYYDSGGTQRFFKTFGTPGALDNNRGRAVAFAADGSVYVAGEFEKSINFGGGDLMAVSARDIFLFQLSATGAHVLSKAWGNYSYDSAEGLSILPSGDVLMTGIPGGSIDFGDGPQGSTAEDTFLVCFSPQGVGRWSKRWRILGNSRLVAAAPDGTLWLATDLNGTPVDFGGGSRSSPTGFGLVTAHLSGTGAHLGSFVISASTYTYFQDIAIDRAGQPVVGGLSEGDIDFGFGPTKVADGKAFFFKQTAAGQVRWARRFGGTLTDAVSAVAVAPDNQILIGGKLTENIMLGTVPLKAGGFVVSLTP